MWIFHRLLSCVFNERQYSLVFLSIIHQRHKCLVCSPLKKSVCQRTCICVSCLPWCGGGKEWIIDWEKRDRIGGGGGDGVFKRSWEFTHFCFSLHSQSRKWKWNTTYSRWSFATAQFVSCFLAALFVHLHFVLCVVDGSNTALSRPFLAHLFLWSLVKMQPCVTAFLNTIFFVLRQILWQTKLFYSLVCLSV